MIAFIGVIIAVFLVFLSVYIQKSEDDWIFFCLGVAFIVILTGSIATQIKYDELLNQNETEVFVDNKESD